MTGCRRCKFGSGVAVLAVAMMIAGVMALSACGGSSTPTGGSVDKRQLILATTTSVKDSGLLDGSILPAFRRLYPRLTVKTIAVGSGEAMAMGARGEADVLLVHSPQDEEAFMAAGHGTLRLPVAYNYFVIVGPAGDPAGVRKAGSAADAFRAISRSKATFLSRADASGTNKKELKLWAAAGVQPSGGWYIKTGQGMGETLQVASEKQGYALTDLATFLAMKDTLDLAQLTKSSPDLKNTYSVIVANQNQFPTVNAAAAEQFAAFLVSSEGQRLIGEFGRNKFGTSLFTPNAGALGQ
jgi:tungstate transport system substrate-binding protein